MRNTPNYHLRQARKDKGWTQGHLAEIVGVSNSTVQRWENTGQFPDAFARRKLRNLLGMTDEQLGFVRGKAKDQQNDLQTPAEEHSSVPFLAHAQAISSPQGLPDTFPLLSPPSSPPGHEDDQEKHITPQALPQEQSHSPLPATAPFPFFSSSTRINAAAFSSVPSSSDEQRPHTTTGEDNQPDEQDEGSSPLPPPINSSDTPVEQAHPPIPPSPPDPLRDDDASRTSVIPSQPPSATPLWFSRPFALLLLCLTLVVILAGAGIWMWMKRSSPNVSEHVPVTISDCDQLLTRFQQLTPPTASTPTDEHLQLRQRLQSCTLPTGTWDSNANGWAGAFFFHLDYRGTLQGTFQAVSIKDGYWNANTTRIFFTRSSPNGVEVQTYTGTLSHTTTHYDLHGTFTDTAYSGQTYAWSATTDHEPDSTFVLNDANT